jgi:16S rRNA (guanine1207-N2)-methyltransferase
MPSGYYAFQTFRAQLANQAIPFSGKPGVPAWDALDPGTRLLAETIEVPAGARALSLGCGTGIVGAVMARTAAEVVLADASVPAVACAARTLQANGCVNARVVLHAGVPDGPFDVIAAHLPRGTALAEYLLRAAGPALRDGGRLYLLGHKLTGIKTFVDRAAQIFGAAHTLAIKAGYRVAIATRTGPIAPPPDPWVARTVTLRGAPAALVAMPGVFAWEGLDGGTQALVETMEVHAGERVLDIGCGAGLAGLAAARLGGAVTLVDADARALEAARRTLAANGAAGEVVASDCAQAVLERRFDVVLANPPFHQGRGVDYDVALQFIRDARALLAPGGRLYLVANAFLPYEREVQAAFGAVEKVFDNRKFKVLRGRV